MSTQEEYTWLTYLSHRHLHVTCVSTWDEYTWQMSWLCLIRYLPETNSEIHHLAITAWDTYWRINTPAEIFIHDEHVLVNEHTWWGGYRWMNRSEWECEDDWDIQKICRCFISPFDHHWQRSRERKVLNHWCSPVFTLSTMRPQKRKDSSLNNPNLPLDHW